MFLKTVRYSDKVFISSSAYDFINMQVPCQRNCRSWIEQKNFPLGYFQNRVTVHQQIFGQSSNISPDSYYGWSCNPLKVNDPEFCWPLAPAKIAGASHDQGFLWPASAEATVKNHLDKDKSVYYKQIASSH